MRTRVAVTAVLAAAAAIAVATSITSPAQAASYRYWTYWQGAADGWTFATAGPASTIPADGAVEGWRFAVTSAAGQAGDAPRSAADFDAICSSTPAEDGDKRVALVVDPGDATSAPAGQTPPSALVSCVVIEQDATGYEVLRSALEVRTEDGLVCGIDGYPAGECAPVVEDAPVEVSGVASTATAATPTAGATDAAMAASAAPGDGADAPPGGPPLLTVGVLAAAALVGVLLWRWRRA